PDRGGGGGVSEERAADAGGGVRGARMIHKSVRGRPAPARKRNKPAAASAWDRALALHRAVGNSGTARLMRNGKVQEIEMQELTVKSLLDHLGVQVRSPFPSFSCWRIGSTRVYVYWRALQRD